MRTRGTRHFAPSELNAEISAFVSPFIPLSLSYPILTPFAPFVYPFLFKIKQIPRSLIFPFPNPFHIPLPNIPSCWKSNGPYIYFISENFRSSEARHYPISFSNRQSCPLQITYSSPHIPFFRFFAPTLSQTLPIYFNEPSYSYQTLNPSSNPTNLFQLNLLSTEKRLTTNYFHSANPIEQRRRRWCHSRAGRIFLSCILQLKVYDFIFTFD